MLTHVKVEVIYERWSYGVDTHRKRSRSHGSFLRLRIGATVKRDEDEGQGSCYEMSKIQGEPSGCGPRLDYVH